MILGTLIFCDKKKFVKEKKALFSFTSGLKTAIIVFFSAKTLKYCLFEPDWGNFSIRQKFGFVFWARSRREGRG
jgi:hypothetical protein